MELLYALFVAIVLGVLILPLVALAQAAHAKRKVEDLEGRIADLRALVTGLRSRLDQTARDLERAPAEEPPPRFVAPFPPPADQAPAPPPPPPTPVVLQPALPPAAIDLAAAVSLPPPMPPPVAAPPAARLPQPPRTAPPIKPAISLEHFLGVKMFAWVGGLALFLGIVFFVKYAFEKNLISPALRTSIGFLIGGGLVAAGIRMRHERTYQVLAQTLAATGVLVLYGVTYAAYELYHFPAFGSVSTFLYMSVITVGAFLLAVRMNAQVIAVLGMAGGFLTPYFVNTGQDNPVGLFGYVMLLDLGLMTVARHRRWTYLVLCAAVGTILTEAGWFVRFFGPQNYAEGAAVWVPISIHLFFPALFALGTLWLQEKDETRPHSVIGGLATAAWSLIVAFVFLAEPAIASRPLILNGFLFAINALVLWQIWLRPRVSPFQWPLAIATFAHLAWWSNSHLRESNLLAGLLSYLVFGLMHSGFAMLAMRRPEMAQTRQQGVWMGPVATVLMMIPILSMPSVPWMIWPAILILDVTTLGVAMAGGRLPPILAALVTTLAALGLWLFRLPATGENLPAFLLTLGAFAALFAIAGMRQGHQRQQPASPALLPIAAAVLPFVLLMFAAERLRPPDPSPLFALALLLGIFLLYMIRKVGFPALAPAVLACLAALQYVWYGSKPEGGSTLVVMAWFVGFALVMAAYPFVCRRHFDQTAFPWMTSAAAWLVAFPLVHHLIKTNHPNEMMGLIPAAFAIPPLLSLAAVLKTAPPLQVRQSQLAWYGGTALLFVTLIFPVQFDRQWITIGWALEGAALCWLYRRVPHEGLRKVGVALLIAAFVRLALNPAVLTYHTRSGAPVWNWFLYTYGIAALAQFAAAIWLAPPRDRLGHLNIRAMAWAFGVILLFLLLNIQIADYFAEPGQAFLAFEFGGHFARSMTYSISWALFALALLITGFRLRIPAPRYAGIALMGVTLVKLFFNDLANIGSIYRISALIIVAVIALGASFLYQRFYSRETEQR